MQKIALDFNVLQLSAIKWGHFVSPLIRGLPYDSSTASMSA